MKSFLFENLPGNFFKKPFGLPFLESKKILHRSPKNDTETHKMFSKLVKVLCQIKNASILELPGDYDNNSTSLQRLFSAHIYNMERRSSTQRGRFFYV